MAQKSKSAIRSMLWGLAAGLVAFVIFACVEKAIAVGNALYDWWMAQ